MSCWAATFLCDTCLERCFVEDLCPSLWGTARCLRCCDCGRHGEVEGRVVWTPQHGWRGLGDSSRVGRADA